MDAKLEQLRRGFAWHYKAYEGEQSATERTVYADAKIVMRRMVAPGHLEAEIDHIRDDHGNEWARQTGETEAAFIDRAASETPPSARGIRALIGTTLEHSHEND